MLMIDSKEIIKKTGISRATLNNYIRLGIIPRPIVKRPDMGYGKTKKIGFFPQSVLESIEKVKSMKKEGRSIDEIVSLFSSTNEMEKQIERRHDDVNRATYIRHEGPVLPHGMQGLSISIDSINTPAYLINYKCEIEWINQAAEEKIFRQPVRQVKDSEARNALKLLIDIMHSHNVRQIEKILDLHMTFFKPNLSKEYIPKLFSSISENELDVLNRSFDRSENLRRKDLINQTYIDLINREGEKEPYRLYVTFFREGLFFLYEPANIILEGVMEYLTNRSRVINDLLQRRMPTLINFCVIVADLQDSVRICAELPPEEYFELIHQMRKRVEESFSKYYGVYGKHAGDGLVYYFLKDRDQKYITNSILCSLEIKDKMEQLSDEWKRKKKWDNTLHLNVGINEGQEYFSAIPPSAHIEFTALGDTINSASRLSDLARNGTILTTKNLINRMDQEDRGKFVYGIRRKTVGGELFIENMFTRVVDLVDIEEQRKAKMLDIAALSVTEIIGRSPHSEWY